MSFWLVKQLQAVFTATLFFDQPLQIQMKVKLAIATPTTVVRIRSKSRVKGTRLQTQSVTSNTTSIILPATAEAKNSSNDKARSKDRRKRSCSKLHCEHKSKKTKENLHQDQYYNTANEKPDWKREREELLRENEKLKRENKVLNDYFSYLECKDLLRSREQSNKQKVFSFKEMQECDLIGGESKIHKTSITKANSKMQYLEEFY